MACCCLSSILELFKGASNDRKHHPWADPTGTSQNNEESLILESEDSFQTDSIWLS